MNANSVRVQFTDLSAQFSASLARDMLMEKYEGEEDQVSEIIDELISKQLNKAVVDQTEDEGDGYAIQSVESTDDQSEDQAEEQPEPVTNENALNMLVSTATGEAQPKKKAKKDSAPSKASVAAEIYANATDRTRKVIIQRFIDEAGLTKAGAQTYYAVIKTKYDKAHTETEVVVEQAETAE